MKAIILAAGRGSRLGPHTDDKPKTLLQLGDKPLIQRSLENLRHSGIEQVVVVVGYRHKMIEEVIYRHFASDFCKVVINSDYTRGSGSSLICARQDISGDVLILESDLLYDLEVVKRIIAPNIQNALAMGHFRHGRKEVKIYLNNGHIAKAAWGDPDDKEAAGDWVGFTRLNSESAGVLQQMLHQTSDEQGSELNYEDFLFRLLRQFPFQAVYIDDLPWIEIDNHIDFIRAQTEIYPRLSQRMSTAM